MRVAKRWILDTGTKGTGAHIVPLEDSPKGGAEPLRIVPKPEAPTAAPRPKPVVEKRSTPLPPGHVRKKSTGEIGKVKAVDPKAGTVTVSWLRGGTTSTVPLSSVTRK
jgi:hypothetical protein